MDVGGPGWSQRFPLVGAGGARQDDVSRSLQMRLLHLRSHTVDPPAQKLLLIFKSYSFRLSAQRNEFIKYRLLKSVITEKSVYIFKLTRFDWNNSIQILDAINVFFSDGKYF